MCHSLYRLFLGLLLVIIGCGIPPNNEGCDWAGQYVLDVQVDSAGQSHYWVSWDVGYSEILCVWIAHRSDPNLKKAIFHTKDSLTDTLFVDLDSNEDSGFIEATEWALCNGDLEKIQETYATCLGIFKQNGEPRPIDFFEFARIGYYDIHYANDLVVFLGFLGHHPEISADAEGVSSVWEMYKRDYMQLYGWE